MGDINIKAGVVAYRKRKDRCEVLLVSSRKYPGSWVFPVGGVERGETPAEAAIRECREESGYIVEIKKELIRISVNENSEETEFIFFSAEVISETETLEKDRIRRWVSLSELESSVAKIFLPVAKEFLRWLSCVSKY